MKILAIVLAGSLASSKYFLNDVRAHPHAPTYTPTSWEDDDGWDDDGWEEKDHDSSEGDGATASTATIPDLEWEDKNDGQSAPPAPPVLIAEEEVAYPAPPVEEMPAPEKVAVEEMPAAEEPAVAETQAKAEPAAQTASKIVRSFPDGVPGSGYGCDRTCGGPDDDADVYYTIRASLETYQVPGSEGITGFPADRQPGPVSMFTRTFTGVPEESSPFCADGDDGTTGPLGPCMQVKPGQRVKIRVVNDMNDGMTILKQRKPSLDEYWGLVAEPGQPNLDAIEWFGALPETPEDMYITNEQDLPGWDVSFDDVNIHFHGLQVVPHLFYPQGTGNPKADWITITPESINSEQRCFCYILEVPSDHPQGTFWWHIHRHGSVAMQAWQGMVGFLQVGDETSPGSPEKELAEQGVIRTEWVALWEWVVMPNRRVGGDSSTFYEGNFLEMDDGPSPITTYLMGNAYQPTYSMRAGETVHWRFLCAQTTTGSGIFFQDESGNAVEFYVFASDGISYSHAVKQTALVIGPGQREGLLLQFPKAGKYGVQQLEINDFQGDGETNKPTNAIAFIEVTDDVSSSSGGKDNVDLSTLVFTPGMSSDISTEEVVNQVSVNFEVHSMKDRAPVPQFIINGKEFDSSRIDEKALAATGTSWTLTSNMNYFHPFHIHVNPFQVMSIQSGELPGILIGSTTLQDAVFATSMNPTPMWRDTTFIPPWGMTTIRQRFGESISWTGKTVFHCHFLDHEDQGMISAMMILDPNEEDDSGDSDDWEGDAHEAHELEYYPKAPASIVAQNQENSSQCSAATFVSLLVMSVVGIALLRR
eukprot:CAMPEP_0172548702 /NCGR_PEP_ID=MMETSP1067-20121228/17933_1 /TAXON_ID=265564 ORGANISM="Thalassiosira punctigera, Strain Tpunct2005C2" /NCGR_SAMPLE_ID=MMETSP1067 /ASSEMBLY_ACC=CAM_ASM_000444 /LENGTH=814 /DNA_ID=CAMNT_0013335957 /DNA_START=115 /DNA_END=2559 /DNA_ORIENTATION=+